MFSRLRSLQSLLLVAGSLLLPVTARAQDPALESGIFELLVPGLNQRSTVRVLVDSTGRVLAPLSELLLITGIPNERSGPTWRFEWPPPGFRTELDLAAGTVTRDGAARPLAPGSWVLSDGQPFVDSAAVAALFGAVMRTTTADLVVMLMQEGGFPNERRLEQELRREARMRMNERDAEFGDVAYRATSGIGALNWDASAVLAEGNTHGVVRGVAGAAVLGGSLELAGSIGLGIDLSGRDAGSRFVRPFPNNPFLQQATFGSISSPTPIPRFIVGAHISNTPYIRPNDFQEIAYQPTLPPGWTAEVYEGETLIGVIGADRETEIDVPVGYGYTPLRIRMLGPAGQERNEQLQYLVPATRLPSRRIEYNLGFGECRTTTCDRYGFADLTRGLSSWATAGVGVDWTSRPIGDRTGIYTVLSVNPMPNLSFETQTAGTTHARAALQFLGARNTSVSTSLAWYDPDDPDLTLGGLFFDLASSVFIGSRALSTSTQLRVEDERVTEARVFTGLPFRFGFLGAQWNRAVLQEDLYSARTFLTPGPRAWLPPDFSLGVTSSFSSDRFELLEINASMSLHRHGTLNAFVQWRAGGQSPALSLNYTFRTPYGIGQSRLHADRHNPSVVLGLSGGLAASHRGDLLLQPVATVGRAGILGTAFLDANGNGRRDAGEEAIAGVPIVVDAQRVVSDSDGNFRLWDAPAVRGTMLVVDSLDLRDARLTPARPFFPLRLVANTFTRVDVPLIRTREISGSVLSDGRAIAGIAVELHGPGGLSILQTRTFSDGEFYFPRVPPGDYTLIVSPASLAALDMTAQPGRVPVIVPFQPGPPIRIPPVRLTPRG